MFWNAVGSKKIFQYVMDKYLYLIINCASLSVPFLASFYPKHPFYKYWKNYFIANFIIATLFILWDSIFTKLGVWGFNDRYITGIKYFGLPIEEILFFFCIPYSSVFVYFSINYLLPNNTFFSKHHKKITLFLVTILLFVAVISFNKWYTFTTFTFTGLYLFFNYLIKYDLSRIYRSYCVTLFFFFIVNGILTGTAIEEEVVWYDNFENLGIRMGTIPVEDTIYGFLLVASIIQIFEFLNKKQRI